VMVSSKRLETGVQFGPLSAAAVRGKCGKRAAFSNAALLPSIPIGEHREVNSGIRLLRIAHLARP
jgi:hypothetical protein